MHETIIWKLFNFLKCAFGDIKEKEKLKIILKNAINHNKTLSISLKGTKILFSNLCICIYKNKYYVLKKSFDFPKSLKMCHAVNCHSF